VSDRLTNEGEKTQGRDEGKKTRIYEDRDRRGEYEDVKN
jgi:hypothetical protein